MLYKATQEAKFDEVVATHMGIIGLHYSQLQTKVGEPFFLGFLVSFLYFFPLCEQQSGALDETLVGFSVGLTGATIHKAKLWHNERLLDYFCCRKPLPAQTIAKGALLFYYSTLNRHIKRISSNPAEEPVGFNGEC